MKQGLEIITINLGDEKAVVAKYWKAQKYTMLATYNGEPVAEKYKIVGTPTNYIINGKGKVVQGIVGFDESALKKALAKAGLK